MQARMKNPAIVLDDAMNGIQNLYKAMHQGGVAATTLELVHMRASQINGCSACVDAGVHSARKAGETDDRLLVLPAWRETSVFTDAERAALALTEATTRLSDRADPIPDEIWDEAARHYDEPALAALIISIASINVWNRLNVATRQAAGVWTG